MATFAGMYGSQSPREQYVLVYEFVDLFDKYETARYAYQLIEYRHREVHLRLLLAPLRARL